MNMANESNFTKHLLLNINSNGASFYCYKEVLRHLYGKHFQYRLFCTKELFSIDFFIPLTSPNNKIGDTKKKLTNVHRRTGWDTDLQKNLKTTGDVPS